MKFGRLPALIPAGLKDLTYYVAGPLPQPPPKVDVPAVSDWMMLGNDEYGDCGVAGLEHGFMAAAAATGETETFPGEDQAVEYYLDYTSGQDSGVVLSQYLAHVRDQGYYGKTISAYAPVTVNDIPTLQFAVNAYDFAYTGISVYQGMMSAVQEPSPWVWTMEDLTGEIVGGHCIPVVAYDSSYLYAVSWGSVVAVAYPVWHAIASEAWAVITGELAAKGDDGRGISLPALQADLNKLGR
jgi:hypothetical protein